MKRPSTSRILLSEHRGSRAQQLELFAIVNLGIVQSLASGALTPAEAVQRFYHATNCLLYTCAERPAAKKPPMR